jgi:hypothetical protein
MVLPTHVKIGGYPCWILDFGPAEAIVNFTYGLWVELGLFHL